MKVVSYLKSVPRTNSNEQKTLLLKHFVHGVNVAGDTGILHDGDNLVNSDVGVIQGWVYDKKTTPHLTLRDNIINHQINTGRHVCCADANLFLYANKVNQHGYLRYSFNGIFPTTGEYCDAHVDPNRWNIISRDTGIQLQPTIKKGKYIVLMMQRNGGWSMKGLDVQEWAIQTINRIRKHSDRPIVVRAHPGDRAAHQYLNHRTSRLAKMRGVRISEFGTPLEQEMHKAWAVVNHNSSSVVGPIIQGYHSFITDSANSQCKDVSHDNFHMIENPQEFDRQAWLERISMFHWKFDELSNGTCWRHMRNYCQ
jgi:hypothetical protein